MRLLDEEYTARPFYGSRRMRVALQRAGHVVNRKHIQRLMRLMGLEAVGPKPRLSAAQPGHRVYPYLLRHVPIVRVDQVWSTDITYVRLRHGFVYLVAVLDWFSRYVLAWELSVTVDGQFCLDALETALSRADAGDLQHGPRVAIHRDRVYGSDHGGRGADQHGRPGPRPGQRLCRTAVAIGEIRRGVPEGLCVGTRRPGPVDTVFPLLQPRAPASKPGLPDTGAGVRGRAGGLCVTGGAGAGRAYGAAGTGW